MLIYPGVAPLDVAGPLQVFGVSNFLRKQKLYEILTVAPTAEPVPTPARLFLLPACAMADLALPVDTLLVSGGGGPDAGTQPDYSRLAAARRSPGAPLRLDLHRRLRARRRRAASAASGSRRTGRSAPSWRGAIRTPWSTATRSSSATAISTARPASPPASISLWRWSRKTMAAISPWRWRAISCSSSSAPADRRSSRPSSRPSSRRSRRSSGCRRGASKTSIASFRSQRWPRLPA